MSKLPTNLPTGTVTFLFTDIEGSTQLWDRYPDQAHTALARHDQIIETTVAQHKGTLVRPRGEGDSRFAVFPHATDAVAAAATMQRALHFEPWSLPTPLRVRMALHTGEADLREGDYYGSAVNRCARLRSVAHGGQTLLSRATCDLVRDSVSPGVELRDLGEHRLRDLQRPEYIFQLDIEGLPAVFPPLNTVDLRPNNLPSQPSLFIGRDRELEIVCGFLRRPEVRLLTLTGPGGTGKTRLALQAAVEVMDGFRDGIFFVSLASISDPQIVIPTIAQTLDVKEESDAITRGDALMAFLRDKQMLLVLDNFEQVLAAAPLLAQLLANSVHLRVMVTSQVVLRLQGEQEFIVPPLALPDPALFLREQTKPLSSVEVLSSYEAVNLFVQRARQVKPDFELTEQNAYAVAEISYRLDGLPLAIELAAARIKLLTPEAMLVRLSGMAGMQSSLKLLVGGARDLPVRQQTLRSTIEWSYGLLDADERALFRRLSIFAGCTLEAVETVCSGETMDREAHGSSVVRHPISPLEIDVLDGVASLVDRSLLQVRNAETRFDMPQSKIRGQQLGEPRYSMLKTIREHARDKLEESGEVAEVKKRHARYYLALAETGEYEGFASGDIGWLEKVEAEQDNMRAALQWSLDEADAEMALRLSGTLSSFWQMRGDTGEGRRWAKAALVLPGARQFKSAYAHALIGTGTIGWFQGDLTQAHNASQESATIFRELGDERGLALSLITLGQSTMFTGDYEQAHSLMAEGLALYRRLGVKWGTAQALFFLGQAELSMRAFEAARASFEESGKLYQEFSNDWWEAQALNSLGDLARMENEYDEARRCYEQSLVVFRKLRAKTELPASLHNLGHLAIMRNEVDEAGALFRESLALHLETGNRAGIAESVAGFAALAGLSRQPERAARLFGASDALRTAISAPDWPAERAAVERNVALTRAQLDEATWQVAWEQGRTMSMEQSIAYALEES